ncbi:MAG: hypothetical protein ACRCW1_00560 [Anaerotignaceae bacterium]
MTGKINILEIEFEKQLKENINKVVKELEYTTSDDFAQLTTYMINNNFNDNTMNEFTEVFNNILARIKNQRME